MDVIFEELQLLGLINTAKEEFHLSGTVHITQAIKALLALYHSTFNEKNNVQELCTKLTTEITKLQEEKNCLIDRITAQERLLSNNQHKEELLLAQLNDVNQRLTISKKEVTKEKLKWERWVHLERASLCKSQQQVNTLISELRKKAGISLSNAQIPLSSLQVNHIKIFSDIPPNEAKEHESYISNKEEILKKAIQRWDSAHRDLVKESVLVNTSLQSINAYIQQSVNDLKSHFCPELKDELILSDYQNNSPDGTSVWISHVVDNICLNCLELSKVVKLLLGKTYHCGINNDVNNMNPYLKSLDNFGAALDRAEEAFKVH